MTSILYQMSGKYLAAILALLSAVTIFVANRNTPAKATEFQNWKLKFGIVFDSQFEEVYREKVFLDNLEEVKLHNARKDITYQIGINQFSHLTNEEFSSKYLGRKITRRHELSIKLQDNPQVGDIDWVAQGAVTSIKSQGNCDSDYAFTSAGVLQGLNKIVTGTLQSFSAQQLVDCTANSWYGNDGCDGGGFFSTLGYVMVDGIATDQDYPYEGFKQPCKTEGGKFKITDVIRIPPSCTNLANALVNQPIAVELSGSNWKAYKSGIFNNCAQRIQSQEALLVGMTDQYWKVKNSWGATWGQNGYIRLAPGNTCGICQFMVYPKK